MSQLLTRRCWYITTEASPTAEVLLDFVHVGLVEYPYCCASWDILICDDVQPLVVSALDKHVMHDALFNQPKDNGFERDQYVGADAWVKDAMSGVRLCQKWLDKTTPPSINAIESQ